MLRPWNKSNKFFVFSNSLLMSNNNRYTDVDKDKYDDDDDESIVKSVREFQKYLLWQKLSS
jgi:hypothetical protein